MIDFSSGNVPLIPKPVVYFFLFLAHVKFAASVVLRCLGLHDAAGAPLAPPWREHAALLFSPEADGSDKPGASSIKDRLPEVEFSTLLQARRGKEEEEEGTGSCVICLGEVEGRHRVRMLGNCGHAFHVECIDRWVDVGQVSCPLCRALLLPSAAEEEEEEEEEKKMKWRRHLPAWWD